MENKKCSKCRKVHSLTHFIGKNQKETKVCQDCRDKRSIAYTKKPDREGQITSSGRQHSWQCVSCNFVNAGLTSVCELCSAKRDNLPCTVLHQPEDMLQGQVNSSVEPVSPRNQLHRKQNDCSGGDQPRHSASGTDTAPTALVVIV